MMEGARAVGRNAAAMKYDLLTALGTHACAGDKHLQRLALRFITLIVARYNWQADDLSVGQREMAALWSVDERTVKREVGRLRALGWLVVKRQATRGRVAQHGLGLAAILDATAADWARVGPDYAARMGGPAPTHPPLSNVVPFPVSAVAGPQTTGPGVWPRMLARLADDQPALCAAWFAHLTADEAVPGALVLHAPSRFHASFVTTHHLAHLTALARSVDPELTLVEVVG